MIPFGWHEMNRKLQARAFSCKYSGRTLSPREGMRLVHAKFLQKESGGIVELDVLVDLEDGVIADVNFKAFGPPILFAVCDMAMELVIRKTYEKAHRMTGDLLEKSASDKGMPLPSFSSVWINLLLEAIDKIYEQCTDIPFVQELASPPVVEDTQGPYPGWELLDKEGKLSIIEGIVHKEIRPYIELDAGNVKIVDLTELHEIHIAYEGNCTTCYSATGATLHAIEQILKNKVHPDIKVIPDL